MPSARRAAVLAAVVAALVAPTAAASGTLATAPAATSGVNDWSCRPSAEHPRPVVLLHGLNSNAQQHWALHGPAIAQAGYCVFSLTYSADSFGMGGQAPVAESAREVGAFIDRVRSETGSRRVDLVGHSLGAFVALYVTKVGGYARKIRRVVAMAPPTHGTTLFGAIGLARSAGLGGALGTALSAFCIACADLVEGGPAEVTLGEGRIAQRGVTYTVIASRFDAVVTPTSRAFIRERGVRNYHVQDVCPLDPVGHFGFGFDIGVTSMILNGLDADVPIRCGVGPPV